VKILYVSQYFPPEMGAPAARVSELSHYWAKEGHEVTVLTGFPNHPTGVIPREYRGKMRRLVMRENVDGVNVVRTWLFPFPNRKASERMLNYSSFCISAAGTGIFVSRPDVLIATSPQLLVGLSGWWLARIKRVPFVFEVRDLWPESLAAVGIGNQDSLLNRSLGAIAGFLYKRSDHIAVVTPAFEDYLIRTWGVPPEKLSVVENGVQTDQFTPDVNSVDLRKQLGAEGKFVVAYIGTMGIAHGLETLLQAAAELKKTMPNVLFLMVGEGADKERIENRARLQELTNILFVGQQAREKVPEFICASDACVVLLKKTDLFKTVIPTKMLEFMSCARPLILGVDGQARKIMDEAKAGLFVQPENVSALVNAIIRLANNSSLCETFGRNGRDHIVKRLSRQQTARVYISILEDVARVGPRHSHAMA
jgi:glycosyltransferase involved in cell wall biosynthesis